ncbi:hypothetical protein [Microcystis aeruginosa]|uniref:hypothetical protein n=1 Tax=Microcystis aeruginosa TaxID=1126 RepID=UPI000AED1986|nr:hypothetical protein [Microcystis aeruginosa]
MKFPHFPTSHFPLPTSPLSTSHFPLPHFPLTHTPVISKGMGVWVLVKIFLNPYPLTPIPYSLNCRRQI